jgi:hypothetical protein
VGAGRMRASCVASARVGGTGAVARDRASVFRLRRPLCVASSDVSVDWAQAAPGDRSTPREPGGDPSFSRAPLPPPRTARSSKVSAASRFSVAAAAPAPVARRPTLERCSRSSGSVRSAALDTRRTRGARVRGARAPGDRRRRPGRGA